MNKITSIILASAICASLSFGADFSKTSNNELVKMAGTVAPKDFPDYKIELHKRMKTMTKEDARKFHQQLEDSMTKNTDKMTMKEFRERREAIRQAVEEKIKGMTKEQVRESGLVKKHHVEHKHKKPAPKPPKPDEKPKK